MNKATKWFVVSALSASGIFAFACGGGNADSNANTTPSASAPATSAAPTQTASATASASAAPTETVAPPAPPPPLVVSAMKFMPGGGLKATIELKDDGSILANGKPAGKIVGAELHDKDGNLLISVAADGSVTLQGATKTPKFDDKDTLVTPDGATFSIDDKGVVKLTGADGKPDKDSGKVKITSFKPTARRAAIVVLLGMLMPAKTSSTGASAPSASPAKK